MLIFIKLRGKREIMQNIITLIYSEFLDLPTHAKLPSFHGCTDFVRVFFRKLLLSVG